MSKFWHRFTCFLENPETAGVALLVAVIGIITAVAFPWYLVSIGRYFSAASFVLGFALVSAVCIRDYRRGKWSILSAAVVVIWVAFTVVTGIYFGWHLPS